jgi:hypothetical protein
MMLCFCLRDREQFLVLRIYVQVHGLMKLTRAVVKIDPGSEFSILDPDPRSKRHRIPNPDPTQRVKVFLTLKSC